MAPALAVLLGLAIILAAIGVLGWLGHLPLNGWAGIRLPSTMSSERAWRSAHRVAGPWFVAAGVVCALGVTAVALAHPSIAMNTATYLVVAATVSAVGRRDREGAGDRAPPAQRGRTPMTVANWSQRSLAKGSEIIPWPPIPRKAEGKRCSEMMRNGGRPDPRLSAHREGASYGLANLSRHRLTVRLLCLAIACAAPLLYPLWMRPQVLSWGATPGETTAAYPGDELVPEADGGATMATTLPAPPESVWHWLVQMGLERGGWYSLDWLDNDGRPSAERIVPEWQDLEEGQCLQRVPEGPAELVGCGRPRAEPHPGAPYELRLARPSLDVRERHLGVPSAAGSRRYDPSGGPYAKLQPTSMAHGAVHATGGGQPHSLHHADPPVPQPVRACRHVSATSGRRE